MSPRYWTIANTMRKFMSGTMLGKAAEENLRAQKPKSRLTLISRKILVSLTMLFAFGALLFGGTSNAAIWDVPKQIAGSIANICNPNTVPLNAGDDSLFSAAMGSLGSADATLPENGGQNKEGNIWSTYNPMVTPNGSAYVTSTDPGKVAGAPKTLDANNVTGYWVALIRTKDDNGNFLYADPWTPKDKKELHPGQDIFKTFQGSGDKNMYPVTPGSSNSAYNNAPTVALQAAYSDAPAWVIHPSYTRYGFDTFQWTTFGASCYSPERYLNVIPQFLFMSQVEIPTLLTFGLLRLSLGNGISGLFYTMVYPLTSLFASIVKPWAAIIAIAIGMPFVWAKSKGSFRKILSSAAWIAAILFGITQLTSNAEAFTKFSQGLVVKVSGTLSCTVANQVMGNKDAEGNVALGGDALGGSQQVPVYDDNGNLTGYQSKSKADSALTSQYESSSAKTSGGVDWATISGVSNETKTQCGSYLDGVYNSIWQGVPLQIWAEGQVGGAQAARDRVAEKNGRIGWYQAILNSMYVNPNDGVGKAQITATTRWNDGAYITKGASKLAQWNADGRSSGKEGEIDAAVPVTPLDKNHTATVWKTVPFLLNVKFLCKDDAAGTNQDAPFDGDNKAIESYATNKWLYDGTCISSGSTDVVRALKGENFVTRIGLAYSGGILAMMVFLFTAIACVYLLYQKFVWGFMLLFAPFILGIAAFPDAARMQFARKYAEFCVANVVKQIMAVMILVVSVTGMSQIVFPVNILTTGSEITSSFYIPWMLKPYVAMAFFIAAIFFALPLKKLITGAVKGDASVVGKLSKTPQTAMKVGAGAAVAAGALVATGGAAAAPMLSGMGRAATGVALRKGGLTGALASVAGGQLNDMGKKSNDKFMDKARKAGLSKDDVAGKSMMGRMALGRQMKKADRLAAKPHTKAALAANAAAKKAGQALPFATDGKGNLTPEANKAALTAHRAAKSGKFWKSPEFASLVATPQAKQNQLDSVKSALLPQFTDDEGNVDQNGLNKAAKKEVAAINGNALKRHRAIGSKLLADDKALPGAERQFLDEDGNMTLAGQRKLVSEIRAQDGNDTALANAATAHKLLAANPEKYNAFVTPENPNGNFAEAMNDAQILNYGKDGVVGAHVLSHGPAPKSPLLEIPGTQAHVDVAAPKLAAGDASASLPALQAAVQGLPSNSDVQDAYHGYAQAVEHNMNPEFLSATHQNLLRAIHNTTEFSPTSVASGLSEGSQIVNENVLEPVRMKGYSIQPDAVREVASSLPEGSPALQQSLNTYANALEEHGAGSPAAEQALMGVQFATEHEDRAAYQKYAETIPSPDYVGYGTMAPSADALPLTAPAPKVGSAPAAEAPSESHEPQAPLSAPESSQTASDAPVAESSAPAPLAPAPQAPRESRAPSEDRRDDRRDEQPSAPAPAPESAPTPNLAPREDHRDTDYYQDSASSLPTAAPVSEPTASEPAPAAESSTPAPTPLAPAGGHGRRRAEAPSRDEETRDDRTEQLEAGDQSQSLEDELFGGEEEATEFNPNDVKRKGMEVERTLEKLLGLINDADAKLESWDRKIADGTANAKMIKNRDRLAARRDSFVTKYNALLRKKR